MNKKISRFLFLFILAVLVILSCHKKESCESCGQTNKPPIAKAGKDTLIMLPPDSVKLDGSLSYDPDGSIIEYLWSGIANSVLFPITNKQTEKPTIKNLTTGVHQFELIVIDNNGRSSKDTVTVFVSLSSSNNRPPVADAGSDQTITPPTNNVFLNGGASRDPDNNIFSYAWAEISGPSSANIVNNNLVLSQVTGLVQGVYQFELRVTDTGGLSANDTVSITINPPLSGLPPVAVAGMDKIITLPTNSTLLNGNGSFDPNNGPLTFNWSKISGPQSGIISNSSATQTQVTSLTEGIYQFRVTVTDTGNLSASDTVKITVRAPTPPTEMIFRELIWNYWHDPNDPMNLFDEIYLTIYDTTNILSHTPISIFVKLDSVGTWVEANTLGVNGNCTPPYFYIISQTASPNTMVLFIESCPLNFSLIGTGASVKIVY